MSSVITMGTKECTKCRETKPLEAFSKRKSSKDGLQRQCKQCTAKYYKDNRESIRTRERKYYLANKEARNAKTRKHYRENKEAMNEFCRKHYRENKAMYVAKEAKRRASKLRATPKWANLSKIEGLYKLARYLTEEHGRQVHVDHIVPLQNPLVCGLHVEDNLQLLFAEDNLSKSNSFEAG